MAYDKVVDSAELEAGLTKIADKIRLKNGIEGKLSFPDEYAQKIDEIGGASKLEYRKYKIDFNSIKTGQPQPIQDFYGNWFESATITEHGLIKNNEFSVTVPADIVLTKGKFREKDGYLEQAISVMMDASYVITNRYDLSLVYTAPKVYVEESNEYPKGTYVVEPDAIYYYDEVLVAFPSQEEKDVNFYDYDGTFLYGYTIAEIQDLEALPKPKEHTDEGLIFQGWNWTLDDLKEYGKPMNVGANYITDDGKTRLYIHLPVDTHLNVPICFSQSKANGVAIDWGDGSPIETNGTTWGCTVTHSYASVGDYVITLTVTNGTLDLGYGYHYYSIVGGSSNADGVTKNQYYKNTLTKIEIGNGVSIINNRAFYNCMKLKKITMPQGVTLSGGDNFHMCPSLEFIVCKTASSANGNAFYDCGSLRRISFNKDAYIGDSFFAYCYTLDKIRIHHAPNGTGFGSGAFFDCGGVKSEVEIPETQTQIYDSMFRKNRGIPKFTFPPSITSIGASAFTECFGTVLYDFTKHSTVPTLANTNAFTGITSDCIIVVPDDLLASWKTATNWSTYASHIKGASEV